MNIWMTNEAVRKSKAKWSPLKTAEAQRICHSHKLYEMPRTLSLSFFFPFFCYLPVVRSSFPLTFPRRLMDIGPCPPGDIFHYHAATALIHRPIFFLINDHAAQQHSRQAQTRHTAKPLVNNETNRWTQVTIKGVSNLYLRRHVADSFMFAQINIDGNPAEQPQLWCLLPAYLCGGPPLCDRAGWRPSVYTAMPSYMGMHVWGRSEVCLVSLSLEKRRDQGSESPPGKQPRLAHLLVSPALPGHSSQPLSNRRAREQAFRGGWEVLRGLKRTRNGEQSTSSFYMSDCSQWTCYSWRLRPPPVFSLCLCVSDCVRVFVCLCVSAGSTHCSVWKQSLFPHC